MDEKALFTKFWTQETRTTRNVLSRIPDSSGYRPDPRSRTAQEIAWQIVCEEKMLIEAMETGEASWNPPPMPDSMQDVLAEYERQSAEVLKRWDALPQSPLILRQRAAVVIAGLELPVRHHPPSRPDHDLSAPDGIHGAVDLRTERGRAVSRRAAPYVRAP
jgi:hypothetical protein